MGGCELALDVGCGTGLQSFLWARAGFRVVAFDVAMELLRVARHKTPEHAQPPLVAPPLFESRKGIDWIERHHERLAWCLEELRKGQRVASPLFIRADLESFPYGENTYDAISCCGSVLSFVDGYAEAIRRMAKALKPGGRLFLEVEQRVNLDALYPVLDNLCLGKLGYEQSWRTVARTLFAAPGKSVRIDYPFELQTSSEPVVLPIWLFSVGELRRLFRANGLHIVERLGIHQITNLLPSTVLHETRRCGVVDKAFAVLRPLDGLLAHSWPFWRLGCSVAFCLEKR